MIDDINDIRAFYERDPQKEHLRLEGHQLEFELTWRFLDKYLPADGKILEVGASTGRYTLELARRGYQVTAVDLSEACLDICRKNLAEAGMLERVRLVAADARDLSLILEKDFDAALLMGPLYHLIELADRQTAIKEARDRLRAGGILCSAFISRFGIFGELLKNVPEWINDREEVRSLLDLGSDPENMRRGEFRGYFARVAEIAPLHQELGFETLLLAGVEPGISAEDESFNCLGEPLRGKWLDLLEEVSMDGSSIGASRHLLYVGRKAR